MFPKPNLVDVSDIFYFFSARGGGRGSPRREEGGWFFIENPRRGGGSFPGEGGAGRVIAANWGIFFVGGA